MMMLLTWIHDCFRPHILDMKPIDFHLLVSVNRTATVIIGIMFGLNIAVVDSVSVLQTL